MDIKTGVPYNMEITQIDGKKPGFISRGDRHSSEYKRKRSSKSGRNISQKKALSRNDTYPSKQTGNLVSTQKGDKENSFNFIAVVDDGAFNSANSATGSRPATEYNHNKAQYNQELTGNTSHHGSEKTFKNEYAGETSKITP